MIQPNGKSSECGAALLSVLLIVSAMSVAALITLDAVGRSVTLSKTASSRTQALWHAKSAEAFAHIAIGEILDPIEHKLVIGMPGLGEPIVFDLEGGRLTSVINDQTNCFNLNSLARTDASGQWSVDDEILDRFRVLLIAIGIFESDAEALADSLADWIDSDTFSRPRGGEDGYYISLTPPYRSAGTLLDNLSELRAIIGYSNETIAQIAPYVCVRPDTEEATLNLNMLNVDDAPLLIALFAVQLEPKVARQVIEQRPFGGWTDMGEFLEMPVIMAISSEFKRPEHVSLTSTYFRLNGSVAYGDEMAEFNVLFKAIPGNEIEAVWRRYGEE